MYQRYLLNFQTAKELDYASLHLGSSDVFDIRFFVKVGTLRLSSFLTVYSIRLSTLLSHSKYFSKTGASVSLRRCKGVRMEVWQKTSSPLSIASVTPFTLVLFRVTEERRWQRSLGKSLSFVTQWPRWSQLREQGKGLSILGIISQGV